MKNTLTNLVLFAALSVAFSSLSACGTASTEKKGAIIEVAPNNVNISSANPETAKSGGNYPPAPVAIMQSDIKDLDGKTFKLEDKKGKVVLVNLWATWCGPCRSEMPHLVEMQNKYKEKDFEILGLNVDAESVEAVKSFGEEMRLNYFLGYAEDKLVGEIMKLSRQQGIPQSVLINREGKTEGVFFGSGAKAINAMKESVEKAVNE
jgi:thiol-disulfide isomerase/thioredoxin